MQFLSRTRPCAIAIDAQFSADLLARDALSREIQAIRFLFIIIPLLIIIIKLTIAGEAGLITNTKSPATFIDSPASTPHRARRPLQIEICTKVYNVRRLPFLQSKKIDEKARIVCLIFVRAGLVCMFHNDKVPALLVE